MNASTPSKTKPLFSSASEEDMFEPVLSIEGTFVSSGKEQGFADGSHLGISQGFELGYWKGNEIGTVASFNLIYIYDHFSQGQRSAFIVVVSCLGKLLPP